MARVMARAGWRETLCELGALRVLPRAWPGRRDGQRQWTSAPFRPHHPAAPALALARAQHGAASAGGRGCPLPAAWRVGGAEDAGDAGPGPPPARATTAPGALKVTLLGAGGSLGRALALLLRSGGLVDELVLYDVRPLRDLQRDLARSAGGGSVRHFDRRLALPHALKGARLVVVAAGARPARTDTLEAHFARNAPVISELCAAAAQHAPQAVVAVLTTPVGACTALAAEALAVAEGGGEEAVRRRVLGVTALDAWRAASLLACRLGLPPAHARVPVVGGTGRLAVPLFSQAGPHAQVSEGERRALAVELWAAEEWAGEGEGGVRSLCAAVPAARFLGAVLRAMRGRARVVECALVRSDAAKGVRFVAEPVELGLQGVQRRLGLSAARLTTHERRLLARALRGHQRELRLAQRVVPPACRCPHGPPPTATPQGMPDVPACAPPDAPSFGVGPGPGDAVEGAPLARAQRVAQEVRRAERRRQLLRAQNRCPPAVSRHRNPPDEPSAKRATTECRLCGGPVCADSGVCIRCGSRL